MTLTAQLLERRTNSVKTIPKDKFDIMEKSTAQLQVENLSAKALKTGDILVDFKMPDSKGETVSLNDFDSDFLVISFYRGGWCPYCNLELKALQSIVPELAALNTELIAVSPETPDNSLTTSEKNEINFSILSDIDNSYAKLLGLVFKMPKDLQDVYNDFNIHVDKHNENENFELPMPATYIINKNKEIIYSFIPEDYRERLDPEVILEVINKQA